MDEVEKYRCPYLPGIVEEVQKKHANECKGRADVDYLREIVDACKRIGCGNHAPDGVEGVGCFEPSYLRLKKSFYS